MNTHERPSRAQLQHRLRLLKRSVLVLAGGSFVALAGLAADKATANGADARPSRPQAARQQPPQVYFGSAPDDALGGSGSPPVAGSHAS
jgi:hypothetical protein